MAGLDQVSYDPQRPFSLKIEEMGALQFKSEVMQMLAVNLAVAGIFVAAAVVSASFSVLPLPEFGAREVLEIVKMYFLIHIGGVLYIVGGKFFQFSDLMSWQMSASGSNLVGTMLKILLKLGFSERRLEDLNAAWRDTGRKMDHIMEEGLEAGADWAAIEYQFLCVIQQIIELKGCTLDVLNEFKKITEKMLKWVTEEYLPTWEQDLLQGKIKDAVSSAVAFEKAKLVVPDLTSFIEEIVFFSKDAVEERLARK
jgi:hypothetical protein